MEYHEGQHSHVLESDSTARASTPEMMDLENCRNFVECGAETADDFGAQPAAEKGSLTAVDRGAEADRDTPAADRTPLDSVRAGTAHRVLRGRVAAGSAPLGPDPLGPHARRCPPARGHLTPRLELTGPSVGQAAAEAWRAWEGLCPTLLPVAAQSARRSSPWTAAREPARAPFGAAAEDRGVHPRRLLWRPRASVEQQVSQRAGRPAGRSWDPSAHGVTAPASLGWEAQRLGLSVFQGISAKSKSWTLCLGASYSRDKDGVVIASKLLPAAKNLRKCQLWLMLTRPAWGSLSGAFHLAIIPIPNLIPLKRGSQKEETKRSEDEPTYEVENQFILRLPPEHASTVREMIRSGNADMKDKLKIDLSSDNRHATVEVKDVSLTAKMVDLPCVVESLKTLNSKVFYKTADISQMLVCTADASHSPMEDPVASADLKAIKKNEKGRQKKYTSKHGITPPLQNVRKKRFHKTTKKLPGLKQVEEVSLTTEEKSILGKQVSNDITSTSPALSPVQFTESPEVEKELKRLLYCDSEAVSVRWEVVSEDEIKKTESQASVPSFEIAPGTSGSKQSHSSSERHVLRGTLNDSSSNDDENEEEEEDDDEEFYYDIRDEEKERSYEEKLQKELQAKLTKYGQGKAKEGDSSIVMEIQKHIHYSEEKLQEIRFKAQRQKDLLKKVESLTLRNHLHVVLERLMLQEKEKNEQISSLQEKLKHFQKK
ncbi:transcription initiation factor TFIID subunit 7-like [Saccopteryx leptura]|uniref:transcription initiation factor TFIID subunit 7-like n=1 Tax=Saccopteryx leptura TaxID=249018 RepID=UPI00339C9759